MKSQDYVQLIRHRLRHGAESFADTSVGTLVIDLSDACNLDCFFCHWDRTRDTRITASGFALAMEADPQAVVLAGQGEPTSHPEFASLLAMVRRPHSVNLVTNGVRVPGNLADWADKLSHVRVSLDASTEATYEALKKKPRLERAIAGVASYLDHGVSVGVSYVVCAKNVEESYLFLRRMYELHQTQPSRFYVQFNALRYLAERPTSDALKGQLAQIGAARAHDPDFDRFVQQATNTSTLRGMHRSDICLRHEQPKAKRCYYSLLNAQIRTNLDVYPCCAGAKNPALCLGNLETDGWAKIAERRMDLFWSLVPCSERRCAGGWDDHRNAMFESWLSGEDYDAASTVLGARRSLPVFARGR